MTPIRTTHDDADRERARRDDHDRTTDDNDRTADDRDRCTADDHCTTDDRTHDDHTTMNALVIDATADLEVHVPRGGDGTLQDGIVTVLDRSAAVDSTEVLDVSGVTPTLNDLRVDASVRLRLHVEEAVEDERDAVREAVADQFGVRAVSAVETDRSA
ncbi:hypothetical protein [Halorussus salinus]|uniref:hypothetical protein n=1 Tax=Halorussus salinus TaxID=1364935 RepID=UPI001EE3BDFA|nr:hypothetical protein [Halorussus salinus]